jgi:hypothetical protein
MLTPAQAAERLTISLATAARARLDNAISADDPEEKRNRPDVFRAAASHEGVASTIGVLRGSGPSPNTITQPCSRARRTESC